ncbi:hypothetical protein JHK86_035150 [Glycine max]|nr:hypothetical protein JHK86_035150 [Glycine max]
MNAQSPWKMYLPVGECIITLEDVALQLGLHIDGRPITGRTYYDWEQMCAKYIGVVPLENSLVGSTLKLKWLKEHMLTLPAEPIPQKLADHRRAYLLGLICGLLMPGKSADRVHLMYLPLSGDFDRADRRCLGAVVLQMQDGNDGDAERKTQRSVALSIFVTDNNNEDNK